MNPPDLDALSTQDLAQTCAKRASRSQVMSQESELRATARTQIQFPRWKVVGQHSPSADSAWGGLVFLPVQSEIQQFVQLTGSQPDHVIAAAVIDIHRAIHHRVGAGKDHVGHVAAQLP